MNKEELSAMIAEILTGMGKEPTVKGSDYKPTQPGPQPKDAHFKEGEYSDCIDGVLQTCQPEYWQAREKRLENAQKELPMDKCNGGEAR